MHPGESQANFLTETTETVFFSQFSAVFDSTK